MGQSTDAILFYGLCFDDETSRPWQIGKPYSSEMDHDDKSWEDRYARLKGHVPESRPYPEGTLPPGAQRWDDHKRIYTAEEEAIREAHRASWATAREIVAASPVEVDDHCSDECRMPLVAVRASKVVSHRGYVTRIDSAVMMYAPRLVWDGQLHEFCELMDIPCDPSKIGWYLVSWWG